MFHDDQTRCALLLAAGVGKRLKPLTRHAPKCLTEIQGVPILEHQVRALLRWGFKRLVVVVGHLAHPIREFLAGWSGALTIDFVVNPRYKTTNNIYSLWLAREVVREPLLLLECDLVFEPDLLSGMLVPNKIAVSPLRAWMRGTTVTIDHSRRSIETFRVGPSMTGDHRSYKTVNMYSLSETSWSGVAERLGQRISEGRVDDYYEAVFAEMVADGSLCFEPVVFDCERWREVDTMADLREARRIFPEDAKSLGAGIP